MVALPDGRLSGNIQADNFFGARHGLETLAQFVIYDEIRSEIQVWKKIMFKLFALMIFSTIYNLSNRWFKIF